MLRVAYDNEAANRSNTHKLVRSACSKKSPVQNGASAVACLLTFVMFESTIRRTYFAQFPDKKHYAHHAQIWNMILEIYPEIDTRLKDWFNELNVVRDIIAHGYIFDGALSWDDDYTLMSVKEMAVSGQKKNQLTHSSKTKILKLHASPNQISFFDAAKFYLAANCILYAAGMELEHSYWRLDGKYLKPENWLENTLTKLNYTPAKILQEFKSIKAQENYKKFLHRYKKTEK